MDYHCYCIYDSKARIFSHHQLHMNDDCAIRSFHHIINDPEKIFSKYPEDYSLHRCARFYEENAKFEDLINVQISTGLECVEPENYDKDQVIADLRAVKRDLNKENNNG